MIPRWTARQVCVRSAATRCVRFIGATRNGSPPRAGSPRADGGAGETRICWSSSRPVPFPRRLRVCRVTSSLTTRRGCGNTRPHTLRRPGVGGRGAKRHVVHSSPPPRCGGARRRCSSHQDRVAFGGSRADAFLCLWMVISPWKVAPRAGPGGPDSASHRTGTGGSPACSPGPPAESGGSPGGLQEPRRMDAQPRFQIRETRAEF